MDLNQLKIKSLEYRKTILDIIYKSGAGHTGGSLSCIDILNVLYNKVLDINPKNFNEKDRNHYIHSKGHSVEVLYTVLCDQGFFSRKDLEKLNHFNSHFIGHPTRKILGIEHNTGALGHGLSVAVGLALSKKIGKLFTTPKKLYNHAVGSDPLYIIFGFLILPSVALFFTLYINTASPTLKNCANF